MRISTAIIAHRALRLHKGQLMLDATDDERAHVTKYMAVEAPDTEITFLQKMHSENILGHIHDAWDVHCGKERWWVITNPTFLYSQEMFPNLDMAITFHVGLCLRIPRPEKQKADTLVAAPFAECMRLLSEADDALSQAQEVSAECCPRNRRAAS